MFLKEFVEKLNFEKSEDDNKIMKKYDCNLPIIKSPKIAPYTLGTSWSVLLNLSYYKVHVYHIWFMGGDLNCFPDIRSLISGRGGAFIGTPVRTSRSR